MCGYGREKKCDKKIHSRTLTHIYVSTNIHRRTCRGHQKKKRKEKPYTHTYLSHTSTHLHILTTVAFITHLYTPTHTPSYTHHHIHTYILSTHLHTPAHTPQHTYHHRIHPHPLPSHLLLLHLLLLRHLVSLPLLLLLQTTQRLMYQQSLRRARLLLHAALSFVTPTREHER